MSNKIKKIFENVIWWSGVVMIGLVFGVSLQFVRTWMNPSVAPFAASNLLSGNVALAAGGSGACYVSYSGSCLTGFTDKGSIGKWGGCDLGYDGSLHNYIFRPAGGTCGSWTSFDSGEEHVCCL